MSGHSEFGYSLRNYNFIGGAGKNALPNTSSDARAVIDQTNGIYQFYYYNLTSLSDLYSLNYYDTPNNDFNNDGIYNSEYNNLPTGNNSTMLITRNLANLCGPHVLLLHFDGN